MVQARKSQNKSLNNRKVKEANHTEYIRLLHAMSINGIWDLARNMPKAEARVA